MSKEKLNTIIGDANRRADLDRRFWSKVAVSEKDKCWLWTARAKHKFGYGAINGGRGAGVFTAHNVAWALTHGAISPEAYVLHKCDVPSCCNPNHLYLGTAAQNIIDRNTRGRRNYSGHSPETRLKLKIARNNGRWCQTDKAREARSTAMKERWSNPEWRERFSQLTSGSNHPGFGKRPSEARLRAISEAAKKRVGYKHSETTLQRMREAALKREARKRERA